MIEIKHKINEKPFNIIHGIFQKYELENLVKQGDTSGYFTHRMGVTPRQPDHLKDVPSEQMTSSYYVPETGYIASKEEGEAYQSFIKDVKENETALGKFTHDKEEKYLMKDGMIAAESEQQEYKKLTAQREKYKNTYADTYGQKFGDNKGLGFVRTTNYQRTYGLLGTALTVTGALTANPALAGAGLATFGLSLGKTPLDSVGNAAKGLLATGLFAASLPFHAAKGVADGVLFARAGGMILGEGHLRKLENSTKNFMNNSGEKKPVSSIIQESKKQRIENLNKSLTPAGTKPATEEEVKYFGTKDITKRMEQAKKQELASKTEEENKQLEVKRKEYVDKEIENRSDVKTIQDQAENEASQKRQLIEQKSKEIENKKNQSISKLNKKYDTKLNDNESAFYRKITAVDSVRENNYRDLRTAYSTGIDTANSAYDTALSKIEKDNSLLSRFKAGQHDSGISSLLSQQQQDLQDFQQQQTKALRDRESTVRSSESKRIGEERSAKKVESFERINNQISDLRKERDRLEALSLESKERIKSGNSLQTQDAYNNLDLKEINKNLEVLENRKANREKAFNTKTDKLINESVNDLLEPMRKQQSIDLDNKKFQQRLEVENLQDQKAEEMRQLERQRKEQISEARRTKAEALTKARTEKQDAIRTANEARNTAVDTAEKERDKNRKEINEQRERTETNAKRRYEKLKERSVAPIRDEIKEIRKREAQAVSKKNTELGQHRSDYEKAENQAKTRLSEAKRKAKESVGQSKDLSDRSIIADMLKEERGRKDSVKKFLKENNFENKDKLREALKFAGVDDSKIDELTGGYRSGIPLDSRIEEVRNILKPYANSATAKIEDFDKYMINGVFNEELFEMDLKNPFTSLHLFNEKKKQLTKQMNEEGYNYYKKNFEDTRAEYLAGRATIKDVIEKAGMVDSYAKKRLGAKTESTKASVLSTLLDKRNSLGKKEILSKEELTAADDLKKRFPNTVFADDEYEKNMKALGLDPEKGATKEEIKNASVNSETKRLEQQVQEKEKTLTEKKNRLQQLEKPSKLDEEASKKKAELETRKQVIEKDKAGIKTQLADSSVNQKTEDELYKKLQSLKQEEANIDKQIADVETQRQAEQTEANKQIRKGAGVGQIENLERQKQQRISQKNQETILEDRIKSEKASLASAERRGDSKTDLFRRKQEIATLEKQLAELPKATDLELQEIDKQINYVPETVSEADAQVTSLEEQLRNAKEEREKLEKQRKAAEKLKTQTERASVVQDIEEVKTSMSPKDLKAFRKSRRERLLLERAVKGASESIEKLRPDHSGYGNRYVQSFLDVMSQDGNINPAAVTKKLEEMSRMAKKMSSEKGGGMHYGGYGAANSTSFFAGGINSAQDALIKAGGTISAGQRFKNMLSVFGAGGWAYDADNFLLGMGINSKRFNTMAGEQQLQRGVGGIMGGLMKHATAPGAMLYMGSLIDEAKQEGRDMTVGEAALASGLGFAAGAKSFTFLRQGTLGALQSAKASVRPIGDIIGKNKAGLPLNTFGKVASRTGKIASGTAGYAAGLGGFLGATMAATGLVGSVRMFADSDNWINRMAESSLYRNSTFDHDQTQMSLTMRQRQLELISRSGLNNRGALLGNEAALLYSQGM